MFFLSFNVFLMFFRQILCKFVLNLLENKNLFEKAHNFIPHLMKIFAKNSDLTVLLETTVNTIDKINSEAMDVEMPEEPTSVVESQPVALSEDEILEQLRHLDVENAKLSVRLEALNDDYESAIKEGNTFDAQKINELIDSLKCRMVEVLSKRNRLLSAPDILPSQSSQNENKPEETLTVVSITISIVFIFVLFDL